MYYISTRGCKEKVTASEAILKGISEDGGLYVPSFFPLVSLEELENLIVFDYPARSAYILAKFLTDYSALDLELYACQAYSKFEDNEPAPVLKLDSDNYILELFHGPTYAFKDIALTILPYLLVGAKKINNINKKTLILVATSGDTGKAALEGFKDIEGVEIVVIYPEEGVSKVQKLQMQTAEGKNVHVIGIDGNFDDAQNIVKRIFTSADAIKKFDELGFQLSSANSINWGRLVPQIVYYFSAYLDMVGSEEIKLGDKVNFVVPTGNFGNILAGYYAKKMGLPVDKLIVASNKNNILTDFFQKGEYDINREFFKTMSPSMDILISSNLERLLFELFDRDSEKVLDLMNKLAKDKKYVVDSKLIKEKLSDFVAYCTTEEETLETINDIDQLIGYVMDPHTAVGANAMYIHEQESPSENKSVLLSTASPFKFASDVMLAVSKTRYDDMEAVKKLNDYIGDDIPDNIKKLPKMKIRHQIKIPAKEVEDKIFDLLKN